VGATVRKTVKVGVSKKVWYDYRKGCKRGEIGKTVEEALKMYLDLSNGRAVLVDAGEKHHMINAFELDWNALKGFGALTVDVYPPGEIFSEEVLVHLLDLTLSEAVGGLYRIRDERAGTLVERPEEIPPDEMHPVLLARKILKGDVHRVDLFCGSEDPLFQEVATFEKNCVSFGFSGGR